MNFAPQNQPQLPNNRKVHDILKKVLNPENDDRSLTILATLQGTITYPPKNGILSRWFSQLPSLEAKLSIQISPRISEDEKILEKARTAEVHKLVVG